MTESLELSPDQLKIVTQPVETPAMLIDAGPGSGKTRVLGARIQWLVEQGVDPTAILALSFTQKAAEELHRRLLALGIAVRASTIHSHALSIIRAYYRHSAENITPRVIDEDAQVVRISDVYAAVDGWRCDAATARGMLRQISRRKRDGLAIGEHQYFRKFGLTQEEFEEIDRRYCEANAEEAMFDFEDLIAAASHLLDLEGEEKRTPSWLFVDEFHDTSLDQFALIEQLARPGIDHLFVVWDPRQSIYRFRGAEPGRLEQLLLRDYEPVRLQLTDNFRSAGVIVDAASKLLPSGDSPELVTNRSNDRKILLIAAETQDEEAAAIAYFVTRRLADGIHPSDIAVLYAKHERAELIEQELAGLGLPIYRVHTGMLADGDGTHGFRSMLQIAAGGPPDPQGLRRVTLSLGPILDEIDWLQIEIAPDGLLALTQPGDDELIWRVERVNALLAEARAAWHSSDIAGSGFTILGLLARAQLPELPILEPDRGPAPLVSLPEDRTYVALDIEATGTYVQSATIIEIGAIRFSAVGEQIGDPFTILIRTPALPAEVAALTGITRDMLEQGSERVTALTSFREWLAADDVLVGHCVAQFDFPLLNREFVEAGLPPLGNELIDTVDLAHRLYPDESHKLEELSGALGLPDRAHHRALPDVETTIDLLFRLLSDRRAVRARQHVEPAPEAPSTTAWIEMNDVWARVDSLVPADATLDDYLNAFALNSIHSTEGRPDAIHLMTIYAAKGLEWDTVFLVSVEDDLFPIGLNPTNADRDEARRLLYVGMTRAREQLVLSWAESRFGEPKRPSRMIEAIMNDDLFYVLPFSAEQASRERARLAAQVTPSPSRGSDRESRTY